MDIQLELPAVKASDLRLPPAAEGSAEVAARIAAARIVQKDRFSCLGHTDIRTNAEVDGQVLEQVAQPDDAGLALLRDAADHMNLSARGYHRVLKVARTIADLDGSGGVLRRHIAEALSYRQRPASFSAAA